jgi:hypothetical protein
MSKRHSQIFSLQLANHDMSFGPREKPPKIIRILRWIALTPAVVAFILPSFKIGKQVQRNPSFSIPDSVPRDSVFTIPADPSISAIRLAGRPLPLIKSKDLLLARATSAPSLDLEMVFRGPQHPWDPKSMLPKLEHPTFDVYSKMIRTEDPTPAEAKAEAKVEAEPISSTELALMTRTDGEVAAACWEKPKFEIQRETKKIKPNVWTPRYASLTATAPGEVVDVGNESGRVKSAIVYHGGGLYSIYRNVKDLKVRKGDKVEGGQMIATAFAGSLKQPQHLDWAIVFGGSEITPESFLRTSTQLCDSK